MRTIKVAYNNAYHIWGSPRKNKFICLLTSPLFHALQYEIINLIYLFIYIVMKYSVETTRH